MADDPMPSTSTCGTNVRHVKRGGTASEDSAKITRKIPRKNGRNAPMSLAERLKKHREKKKLKDMQDGKTFSRKIPMTNAERMRKYRAKKKSRDRQEDTNLSLKHDNITSSRETYADPTDHVFQIGHMPVVDEPSTADSDVDITMQSRLFLTRNRQKNVELTNEATNESDLEIAGDNDAEPTKHLFHVRDVTEASLIESRVDSSLQSPLFLPRNRRKNRESTNEATNESELGIGRNDGDGIVNASLEDGTGSSDGQCLLSSHTAGEPERVQKFGEPCSANYAESILDNEGDHNKVERLCRLCLAELNAFTYIFEFDDIHRFNVADAISDLLGMDLNPDDGHPTKICNDCLEEVAHFRRFKGICFESKAKLKDMIDVKNYYDDEIKSGDGDSHLGAMVGEKNEIPIRSELAEADPRSGDVSMLETHVKREIVDSGEEEMEDSDMRNEDVNTIMNSSQTRLAAGKVHEDVSHSSQHAGRVKVKKGYMIFCQPVNANDKRDNAVESTVTMSDSAQHIKNGAPKKLGIASDSSSDLPVTISTDLVPVKTEISSADKNGADQQEYHSKGRILLEIPVKREIVDSGKEEMICGIVI